MRRNEWARLAAPFAPDALDWCVAQVDREGSTARLEPVVSEAAVVERLDSVLGIEGWSVRFLPLGPDAVVCELALLGVHKSAMARSFAGELAMERVSAWALGRAAGLCGLRPTNARAAWVDFDLEAGEPVFLPEAGAGMDPEIEPEMDAEVDPEVDPAIESAVASDATLDASAGAAGVWDVPALDGVPSATTTAGSEAGDAADGPARSEGQQAIERLVDRLRAEGLGREAAALVVEHGGYGRSAEEARELYRRLRALLLQKGAPS